MAVYSINDLEALSGIKKHTIRIWEARYKLIIPLRTTTNIRYYTDDELKRLLNVGVLNRNGMKISKIAKLSDEELKQEILNIETVHSQEDSSITQLIISAIDMDGVQMKKILQKSLTKIGLKKTMVKVAYPFLEQLGVLWQVGKINPAHEHFASYMIRQTLISSIDAISNSKGDDAKNYLLFLPEGEWHEIGLLFSYYILREAGHEVTYLGQSVPYSDVLATASIKSFDGLICSKTIALEPASFQNYLYDLQQALPKADIIFLASKDAAATIKTQAPIYHMKDISDLEAYLK